MAWIDRITDRIFGTEEERRARTERFERKLSQQSKELEKLSQSLRRNDRPSVPRTWVGRLLKQWFGE